MPRNKETVHQENYRDDIHMGTSTYEAAVFRPKDAPAYIRRDGGRVLLVSDDPPTVEFRYYTVRIVSLADAIGRAAAMQTGESS